MRVFHLIFLTTIFHLASCQVQTEGAGIEWKTLNDEVGELTRSGQYEKGVSVGKAALKVAEQNVGPEHPDLATSLNNLAALYRATNRIEEALKLEDRAGTIQAIKR